MFGSFLPSLGRRATKVYSGRGSRHCYAIKNTCPFWYRFLAIKPLSFDDSITLWTGSVTDLSGDSSSAGFPFWIKRGRRSRSGSHLSVEDSSETGWSWPRRRDPAEETAPWRGSSGELGPLHGFSGAPRCPQRIARGAVPFNATQFGSCLSDILTADQAYQKLAAAPFRGAQFRYLGARRTQGQR
jgi:hypothetical protein